ncbi:MAG: tetratricopeptide repeat protein [Candidatus Hodarchaeales archaeon]|jgi:tetratricopeptide (TPR) repeat protein
MSKRVLPVDAVELFNKGRESFKSSNTLEALAFFEKSLKIEPENPICLSFLGVCIAYERGQIAEAKNLCEKALKEDPHTIENYLNIGKILLHAKLTSEAIEAFRKGLKIDNKNPEIIEQLQTLGLRKKPIISFLSRNNFFNKYLGIILRRIWPRILKRVSPR